jgi:hypothetical protein
MDFLVHLGTTNLMEDNKMTYSRPEVKLIGEAFATITSAFAIKAWSSPDGYPIRFGIHCVPAYDLDD